MIPTQWYGPIAALVSGFLFFWLASTWGTGTRGRGSAAPFRQERAFSSPRASRGGGGVSPLIWLLVVGVILWFLWPHLGTLLPALVKHLNTLTHLSMMHSTTITHATPTVAHSFASYVTLAREDATSAGIDPEQFVRQINQESGFNPTIVSPQGAIGIAQIMPETAQGWNVNPWNPVDSLKAAAVHMALYKKAYGGNDAMALAAYNAGTGGVQNALRACGANWQACLPQETQSYIRAILD